MCLKGICFHKRHWPVPVSYTHLDVYKRQVMEFVGPGVANLSVDYRIGVDVMTTETTCLSSIWVTDDKVKEFYDIHGRSEEYAQLHPGEAAYYDGMIFVELDKIKPMIAMPFHPSNTYTCLLYTSSFDGF